MSNLFKKISQRKIRSTIDEISPKEALMFNQWRMISGWNPRINRRNHTLASEYSKILEVNRIVSLEHYLNKEFGIATDE